MEDEWSRWKPRLRRLCDEIRMVTRAALLDALERGSLESVARPAGRGAGDVTYGLDVPSEERIAAWMNDVARDEPLSVLTEDRGWRHRGPDGEGGTAPLDGFGHGGPRIAIDPVDGTRQLMADLRSAWTVVSFAPAGDAVPRQADLTGGIVAEISTSRETAWRVLSAGRGSPCGLELCGLDDATPRERELRVDGDDRVDGGYFPFFRYQPDQRPAIALLEASFFERIQRMEGADPRNCFDDQYISNAGQLVLLALGTYRMIVDARALVAARAGVATVTSKPYDVGGAIVCAEAAGAVITGADGSPLDHPLDAETPVHFAGYANAATRRRLEPHWLVTIGP